MDYIVKFALDVVNKKSLVMRKYGEVDISTNESVEQINNDNQELKDLIRTDLQPKVKQTIFNVEILGATSK